MKAYTLIATMVLAISQSYVVYAVTTNFNATFDTLTPILEEGPLSAVGIYLNISFTSFYFSPPVSASAGLIPQSTPNYAYGAGSASRPASMTVVYPHSSVSSFNLASLYYGCITNLVHAPAALPVACTITATGYRAGSLEPVAVQEFAFSPAAGWMAPLAFARFDAAFQGLEHIEYVQSPAAGTLFILDNVVGTIST